MKAMRQDDIVDLLNIIPCNAGQHLRTPPEILPDQAAFDTQHVRMTDHHSTFTFGHIFLAFP